MMHGSFITAAASRPEVAAFVESANERFASSEHLRAFHRQMTAELIAATDIEERDGSVSFEEYVTASRTLRGQSDRAFVSLVDWFSPESSHRNES
jgi:hypothetical protein